MKANIGYIQRGKFRPRLTEMVKQNSHEEVESVTKEALAALPNLSEAMTHVTKLKAVGPATASGNCTAEELLKI